MFLLPTFVFLLMKKKPQICLDKTENRKLHRYKTIGIQKGKWIPQTHGISRKNKNKWKCFKTPKIWPKLMLKVGKEILLLLCLRLDIWTPRQRHFLFINITESPSRNNKRVIDQNYTPASRLGKNTINHIFNEYHEKQKLHDAQKKLCPIKRTSNMIF